MRRPTVGILAVQGAFAEHERMLERLNANCVELRCAQDVRRGIDALVLPGGESTAQGKLMRELGMHDALARLIRDGIPTLGTCAGLILLAARVDNGPDSRAPLAAPTTSSMAIEGFQSLPVHVRRNAYGRHLGSFCEEGVWTNGGAGASTPLHMTFIRAPRILEVASHAEVLAWLHDGTPVAVRCGNQIGCAFHPELGGDSSVHRMLLAMV